MEREKLRERNLYERIGSEDPWGLQVWDLQRRPAETQRRDNVAADSEGRISVSSGDISFFSP